MRNRNKAVGVVGTILRKYEWLYTLYKVQNTCTTLETISHVVYEP